MRGERAVGKFGVFLVACHVGNVLKILQLSLKVRAKGAREDGEKRNNKTTWVEQTG